MTRRRRPPRRGKAPYEWTSDTSREAADKVDIARQMQDVKTIFVLSGPLADFEGTRIFAARNKVDLAVARACFTARRRGLELRGDIVRMDETRINPGSDRPQHVYRLREPGDPPPPVESTEIRTVAKRVCEAWTTGADLAGPLAELRACVEAGS